MQDGNTGRTGTAFITGTNHKYNFTAIKQVRPKYEIVVPRSTFPDMTDAIGRMKAHAENVLARFDHDKDVLLLGGDPVAIALAVQVLAQKGKPFTVGKYDREFGEYYFFTI